MPYYFYMCDMIPAAEHWRLAVWEAQALQHGIMGYLPGFATPRIVCDVPYVGKRWVHQVHEYDRERGITYWTKNYRTGIEVERRPGARAHVRVLRPDPHPPPRGPGLVDAARRSRRGQRRREPRGAQLAGRHHTVERMRAATLGHVTSASGEPLRPRESDRDAAVQRVQDAFADGVISHQGLESRLQTVLTARTADEVLAAVQSLPAPAEGRVVKVVAMNGRIRRDGTWRVPSLLRIESEYGKVRLDFSRAMIETRVVDVELHLRFGRATIIAPADAVVDLDGLHADWKQPRYARPRHTSGDGPLIRVSGSMEYGRLTVTHRRR